MIILSLFLVSCEEKKVDNDPFVWMENIAEFDWNHDKIMETPENTYAFIQQILANVNDNIPLVIPDSKFVFTDNKPISDLLNEFLSVELDSQLMIINNGMDLLKSGSPITLTLISDHHASIDGQNDESKQRQSLIRDKVIELNPRIAFVEGTAIRPLTWTKYCHEELFPIFHKNGRDTSTIDDQKFDPKQILLTFWWTMLLENNSLQTKLYGVDHLPINVLVTALDVVNNKHVRSKNLHEAISWLNFTWRERVILANIIEVLREQNQTEAVIVLGKLHIEPFKDLCQRWGVTLIID